MVRRPPSPDRDDGDYWFAPKRYGYGTGLPLTWQAWAATIGYCVAITAAAVYLAERTLIGFAALAIVLTALFLVLCANKTRGGWRWRWGERD